MLNEQPKCKRQEVEAGKSLLCHSIRYFACYRPRGKPQPFFNYCTFMAELAAVLAKRRRKSEVIGAIVENTPTTSIADASHGGVGTENEDEIVTAEVHSDDKDSTFNRADGELKKILQRRRRKSETASSVFIKEARESEADAKHTHQEYNSSGIVGSSTQGAIELRLQSLEMKVKVEQNQLQKAEMVAIQNGRRLSALSPVVDGGVVDNAKSSSEPALEGTNDRVSVSDLSESLDSTEQTAESPNNIGISPSADSIDGPQHVEQMASSAKNSEAKSTSDSKVGCTNAATADMEAKDREDDTNQACAQPIPQADKEKLPVPDVEEVRADKPDPEKSASALEGKMVETKPKIAGVETTDKKQIADVDDENHDNIGEDDGAKDKHTDVSNAGKIEAKPGFFVTPSELTQLRIFLPGFKSIPNERLYNVLPRLMNKTPGDLRKRKESKLDNRPRWK